MQALVAPELAEMNRKLAELSESRVELIRRVGTHILNGSGKQFRPTVLLLVARVGGQNPEASVLAATVVELVHTATLIHDDSVDGSVLRRGRPTVNRAFSDSVSILMGDFVYSKAFSMLAERKLYPLIEVLARTTHRMSAAELLEMDLKGKLDTTEQDYLDMIDGKTAVLFEAACEIGAHLGFGAAEKDCQLFREYGRALGLAFQIADDVMDIAGDEGVIGKDRGNDLREGKVTLPFIAALENSTPEERARFSAALEGPGEINGDMDEVLEWVRRRGGERYACDRAQEYARRAEALLARYPESDARQALADATYYVVERAL